MNAIIRTGALALLASTMLFVGLITPAGAGAFPGANGRIAFNSHGALMTVALDGSGQSSIPTGLTDTEDPEWSSDGGRVAFENFDCCGTRLYVINSDGSGLQLVDAPGVEGPLYPSWSPDGTKLAFQGSDSTSDLFVVDIATDLVTRLTNDGQWDGEPSWSPDGSRIAFTRSLNPIGPPPPPGSTQTNNIDIYSIRPDGSGLTRLTTNTAEDGSPTWSPDGSRIAFQRQSASGFDIWTMSSSGGNEQRVTNSPSLFNQHPAWSPNGQWLAFERTAAGGGVGIAIARTDGSRLVQLTASDSYTPTWQPVSGDTTPPVVTGSPDRAPDANGWYHSPVTVMWSSTDPSPSSGTPDQPPATEVAQQGAAFLVLSGESCDAMLNCARGSVQLSIDGTPPVVTGTPDRTPNGAGWYRAPVTINWEAVDPAPSSGLPGQPDATVIGTEGAGQLVISPLSCDPVGNCSTGRFSVSLDATPPAVSQPSLSPAVIAPSGTAILTASVADTLSGVTGGEFFIGSDPGAGLGTPMALFNGVLTSALSGLSSGTYLVTVRGFDAAGNWASSSATLRVTDPAGSVDGSGYIVPAGPTSDPGDSLPGADGRAKASFSIGAKYRTLDAAAPTGGFKFDFDSGRFHFRSDSLSWLLVPNASTAQLGGFGTIKGSSLSFFFVVSVSDGGTASPDRLSLSIWAPGADIDKTLPLYRASGAVGGQVMVAAG